MKTDLKANLVKIVVIFAIVSLNIGCDEENSKPGINALVSSHSDCKSGKKAAAADETPDSVSCITYSYNAASNTLSVKHINAGFNCCPDSIYCQAKMNYDTIVIQERETASLCNCDCLFDLNIKVTGVETGKWVVKMVEPYVDEPQEQILFTMDLTSAPSGSFCVDRKHYPWAF